MFVRHRAELRGYCIRVLGSAADADDAVQDTMVRGWRHLHRFEGRSSTRTWLYRIATNVCLDMLRRRRRTPVPVDLAAYDGAGAAEGPAEVALGRAATRDALAAAFTVLPPQQRSVLLLRDVVRWEASEVAEFLGTSVPAANSRLQRARATLASAERRRGHPVDAEAIARLAAAFDRADVTRFASLVRDDAA
jgi:RNA polymerase sigma-70 factor (ECF subfamily)